MKHAGGRPLLYKTAEDMQKVIDEYFDYCDNRIKEIHDKEGSTVAITVPEPYTMSGLAYALGMDRRSIIEYKNRDEFFPTIKRARSKVERDVERRLLEGTNGATGAIFNLKNNFGWRDQRDVDVKSDGKSINQELTEKELRDKLKRYTDSIGSD